MDKKQINKLRMFSVVDQVLENHSKLFAELEDLVLGHQRLKDGLILLGQNRQLQEVDNSGLTGNKIDLRVNLINRILQLSAALIALANSTKKRS